MSKIAPTLTMLTEDPPEGFGTLNQMKAQRELRALLAVARAANVWSLTAPVSPAFPGVENRLVKALARLEKVSK
jgi:hypothetical protein